MRMQCAFKIERTLEAKTVKAEARVLKSLQSCSHVVRLVEQGSIDGRSFMVMEVRSVHAISSASYHALMGSGRFSIGAGTSPHAYRVSAFCVAAADGMLWQAIHQG